MNFIYNLSTNYPLFGLSVSLLLFLGFNQLGTIILKNKNINNIISEVSDPEYQKILIAVNCVMIFLFPIFLFYRFSTELILLLTLILIVLGIIQCIFFLQRYQFYIEIIKKQKLENLVIIIFLIIYFTLSMAPITHADALGYHEVVAKFIADNRTFPKELNNFQNLLAGSGEVMMSLSFLFNSEQLGNLIQYSGLLSIVGVIRKNSNNKLLFSLLVLSTPVIIFLCSSPKPQLFPLASNILIFTIIFFNKATSILHKKNLTYLTIIILTFLINSINTKFSFMLSGVILYLLSVNYFFKKSFLKEFLFLSLVFSCLFYFPYIYWKFDNWGGHIYQYILNPFPTHLLGINNFENYLINYKRGLSLIYLLVPRNLGEFTNTIGICLIFFFLIPKIESKLRLKILLIILFYFGVVVYKGQITGRFLVEPIFWLLIILSKENLRIHNLFKIPVYIQSSIVLLFILFGSYNLFPGSISKQYYEKTMNKFANGYSLFFWANSLIKDDGAIISMHRSISLGNNKTISTDFLNYLTEKDDPEIYINLIQKYAPKYFLTFQNSINNNNKNLSIFKNCLGRVVSKKNEIGYYTGRNPFNKGEVYAGLLYELKTNNLLNCIDMKLLRK